MGRVGFTRRRPQNLCDSSQPSVRLKPAHKRSPLCAFASRSQSSHWPPSRPSRSERSAPQLGPDAQAAAQQKRGGNPHDRAAWRTRSRSTRRTSSRTSRSGSSSRSTSPSTPSHPTARLSSRGWQRATRSRRTSKKYTFKLRKGVRFSNGKPMTAADVKFSIDDARAQDKGWGYPRRRHQEHQGARPARRSSSTSSTRGRRSSPTSPCSRTGSSPRTSPARSGPSSTSTRSARARSCGTSGSSGSR